MPTLARQSYITTQHSQIAIFSVHFLFLFIVVYCRSLFNEAADLASLCRLRSPFAIRDTNSKQSKTKIYEKTHLLLRISAVTGKCGPHLMIVMIFVTQNNLKRFRNFRPFPWILPCAVGVTLNSKN